MTGEELRALRERRGLTQGEMAAWINERMGRRYDKQKLSRWETGAERITRDVAALLQVAELERAAPARRRRAVTVAVALQKGGVGKTVTAINLAYVLARAGHRVLLVDADSQSNATAHVGVPHATIVALSKANRTLNDVLVHGREFAEVVLETSVPGLHLVPSGIALANAEAALLSADPNGATLILAEKLDAVRADYDVIVVDCPPNLGIVTVSALNAADRVLIPCQTEPHAIYGMELIQDTIARVRRRTNPHLEVLGVVPTMFSARLSQDRASLEDIRSGFGERMRIFPPVPRATVYPQAAGASAITLQVAPDAPGLDVYIEIATALMTEKERRHGA